MQELYEQYGRRPALIQRKRGFGLPVVLASGATAMALAGFFIIAALGRHETAEPLPPKSSPLEAVKSPTEAVTGSLKAAMLPTEQPVKKTAAPPAPSVAEVPPPPTPAPAASPAPTAPVPLIQAQATPAPPPAPPAVVASAEISTTLPTPIPPLTAPPTAPPLAAAPAPAPPPEPPAATAPKPRPGPSQAEIAAFTARAQDLIKLGDISGARLLLERAAMGDHGPSLLALAETYDPDVLSRWGVIGVPGDVQKARSLYRKAAERGVAAAKERVSALR